jgi:hypothetical protein
MNYEFNVTAMLIDVNIDANVAVIVFNVKHVRYVKHKLVNELALMT